jgi:hypothetical protein
MLTLRDVFATEVLTSADRSFISQLFSGVEGW